MNGKPLCIDLCCGLGGWAEGFLMEGYRVVGFDVDSQFGDIYPGEFVQADIRTLDGQRFRTATCIVASPPCVEFTRLRFLRKDPPPPDMTVWDAAMRIRKESGVPTVIENVEGARAFVGEAVTHRGPWYLWGDVPILFWGTLPPKEGQIPRQMNLWHPLPDGSRPRLQAWGRRRRSKLAQAERAKIPLQLARAVARGFM